ncbi:MAG: hypothetical protein AABY22_36005, partial [Nanoarchaeota archaeon]
TTYFPDKSGRSISHECHDKTCRPYKPRCWMVIKELFNLCMYGVIDRKNKHVQKFWQEILT